MIDACIIDPYPHEPEIILRILRKLNNTNPEIKLFLYNSTSMYLIKYNIITDYVDEVFQKPVIINNVYKQYLITYFI